MKLQAGTGLACSGFVNWLFAYTKPVPSERNSYWGRPIVFLLIQYTVIKETYYSLTIIGEAHAPLAPALHEFLNRSFCLKSFWLSSLVQNLRARISIRTIVRILTFTPPYCSHHQSPEKFPSFLQTKPEVWKLPKKDNENKTALWCWTLVSFFSLSFLTVFERVKISRNTVCPDKCSLWQCTFPT